MQEDKDMYKRIPIFLVMFFGCAAFITGCVSLGTEKEDVEITDNREELKLISEVPQKFERNVKTETGFSADGKKIHFFEFDENGNRITEYYYDENGTVDWRNSYTREYNETGKMIVENSFFENGSIYERKIWEYELDDRMIAESYFCSGYQLRYVYEYDQNGNQITKYMHKERNGKIWDGYVEKCKYDKNGNLIAEYSYKDDGTISWVSSHVYEYDQDNNKLVQYSFDIDDKRYIHYTWSYDNNGKVLDERCFKPDGTVDWWDSKTYKRDTNGNIIEKCDFHENGSIRKLTIRKYDSDKNLETEFEYNDGDILHMICEYDSDGRIMLEKIYNDDGSVSWSSSSTFEYDKNGNLITRYNYDDNGNVCFQYKYEYNTNGDCIAYLGCTDDNSIEFEYQYVYTYYN